MKKTLSVLLLLCFVSVCSVYAIDGRSDIPTKESTAWGGWYIPTPVGMAINEKGLPWNSCPKWCWWNRRVNDCRCAQSAARVVNIPWTNPLPSCVSQKDVLALYETDQEKAQKKSKEDVYVRKVTTKEWWFLGVENPGIQVVMTPSQLLADRNPSSVKCWCGTDVRWKDQAACDRICDFLKNNTNKTVCPTETPEAKVSPRDSASWLATGKRQHKPFTITKEIDKSTPLGRGLKSVPGYECDVPEWRDNFTYPLLSGIKCELKEMPVDDDIKLELWIVSPRDPASWLPTGKRMGSDNQANMEADYTWPCRPPYLCIELSVEKRKWWDGTIKWNANYRSEDSMRKWRDGSVKWNIEESSIVSPRDSASWLPTGKRQHKPITLRVATNDQDCDDRDDDCDGMIVIEADLDGDGQFEPLHGQPLMNKEKPKTWTWTEGKKEYVGHVTLMK